MRKSSHVLKNPVVEMDATAPKKQAVLLQLRDVYGTSPKNRAVVRYRTRAPQNQAVGMDATVLKKQAVWLQRRDVHGTVLQSRVVAKNAPTNLAAGMVATVLRNRVVCLLLQIAHGTQLRRHVVVSAHHRRLRIPFKRTLNTLLHNLRRRMSST
eukprot:PhF_6_TR12874/c0_g1_i1/m.20241